MEPGGIRLLSGQPYILYNADVIHHVSITAALQPGSGQSAYPYHLGHFFSGSHGSTGLNKYLYR